MFYDVAPPKKPLAFWILMIWFSKQQVFLCGGDLMLLMQPFKIVESSSLVVARERERLILNQYVTDNVDIVACRHK